MSSHKLGNGPLKVGIVTMNDEANVPVQTKFSMTSFQAVRMTEKSLSGSQIPSQIHEDQNLILTRMTGCGPIDCKDPNREMKIRTAKQCVMSTPSMDKRPGHLSNRKTLNLSRSQAHIYGDDKHPAKAHQEIKDTRFTEGLCDGDQVHEKTLKRDVIGPSGHLQSQQVRKVKGGDAWD